MATVMGSESGQDLGGAASDDLVAASLRAGAEGHVTLDVGDRVEGGRGEDQDAGRVTAIDGDQATVAWDSHITTTQTLSLLRLEARS